MTPDAVSGEGKEMQEMRVVPETIVWKDPPPRKGREVGYRELLEALASKVGKWAIIRYTDTPQTAKSCANYLRAHYNTPKRFSFSWGAETNKDGKPTGRGEVYARMLPTTGSGTKT